MQVDVYNARVFGEFAADRIHGNDIFRIVIAYVAQVSELSCDGFFRTEQIHGLYIELLLSTRGHKIDLTIAQDAYRDFEALYDKVVENDIFYYFLDAAAQVESAEQVAQAVVGEIIFVILLEDALSMDVISLDRGDDECPAQIAQIGGGKRVGYLFAVRLHGVGDVPHRNELADVIGNKCGKVFNKCHVTDFLPCDDIA